MMILKHYQKPPKTPGGGYSTLGWVRMCGPKFRPPPYNKTREDTNLQPITKPFASRRTLFKTNQYFLPYKLGCISTFWQPIGKLKGKIQRKLCVLQKCDLYLNQFSNKKGAIGKPERPKKHPIWAAHPRTHLSTKYPPPGQKLNFEKENWSLRGDFKTHLIFSINVRNFVPDIFMKWILNQVVLLFYDVILILRQYF